MIIAHSDDLETWYAHMTACTYPGGIQAGSTVRQGQVIGYEGNDRPLDRRPPPLGGASSTGNFVNPRLFL